MKIELEIPTAIARALAARGGFWVGDEMKEDAVKQAAEACLGQYCGFPDVVTQEHLAAMAVLRSQVAEHAAFASTEGNRQTPEQVADRLLDFVLRGR